MFERLRKLFARRTGPGDAAQLPDSVRVDVVDGITIVTVVSSGGIEETKRVISYLHNHGIYERRIWDVSGIDFPFTIDELRELAYYGRELMGKANRMALVVKDNVGFGSSRAFATYREGDNTADVRVFKSMDEAREWILKAD